MPTRLPARNLSNLCLEAGGNAFVEAGELVFELLIVDRHLLLVELTLLLLLDLKSPNILTILPCVPSLLEQAILLELFVLQELVTGLIKVLELIH